MSHFVTRNNMIGFGSTKEEAENDWYNNNCRQSLSNDVNGIFTNDRDKLSPWLPKDNMLHISTVGCLMYDKNSNTITECVTNKSMQVISKGPTVFYYLAHLFGSKLSYTDITVVCREEIDQFFANISSEFTPIKDIPFIKPVNGDYAFDPDIVYSTDAGIVLGVSDSMIGIKDISEAEFFSVDIENGRYIVELFSYIGYYMDVIISNDIKVV